MAWWTFGSERVAASWIALVGGVGRVGQRACPRVGQQGLGAGLSDECGRHLRGQRRLDIKQPLMVAAGSSTEADHSPMSRLSAGATARARATVADVPEG